MCVLTTVMNRRRLIPEERWRGGLIDTYESAGAAAPKKQRGQSNLMHQIESLTEYLQQDMTEVTRLRVVARLWLALR